jgi:ribulose 1,5-bisphosphate synthetase/thiazole synthase
VGAASSVGSNTCSDTTTVEKKMQPIPNTGNVRQALSDSTRKALAIGIIGAGAAGLINAHVLLQDGYSDVTLVSRDKSVGGTWARARVYPGLHINK